MNKIFKQYRFYNNEDTTRNYPANISLARLTSGSIFFSSDSLGAITQLGIQALPGTKFYLNNGVNPVIVGATGVYELNLENVAEITALSFDIKSLNTIAETDNAYLIVDAVYNAEED